MKKTVLNQSKLNVLEYVLVLFVILDTNTVYSSSYDIDYHIPEITAALLFLLLILRLMSATITRREAKKLLAFCTIYYATMVLLFVLIVGDEAVMSFLARFIMMLPMLTIYFFDAIKRNDWQGLINKYINIMVVIASVSLFFWVFGSQFHLIRPNGYFQSTWGGRGFAVAYPSYYGLYFERQMTSFLTYNGLRNQGIFAEGPMFSLCLVIALASELFLLEGNYSKKIVLSVGQSLGKIRINYKSLLLSVALITTFTTTGQVLLIIMLIFKYALGKPKDQFSRIMKAMVWILVACGGLTIAVAIFVMKSTSMSWMSRVDDFRAGFQAWLVSPIYGNGFGDYSALDPFRASFIGKNAGFSNSITTVLFQGGILLFLVYLIPFYVTFLRELKRKEFAFTMFICILVLEFIFTSCAYIFTMLFFVAFLYSILLYKHDLDD